MKKLLIISLALVTITSCSKDQTIEQPDPVAIEINDVFVNNSTKANDISKDNLNDFGVYGFVKALNTNTEGLLFNNVKVSKSGTKYTYSPEQYWIGNAQYYFAAIAPFTNAKWGYSSTDAQNGTITFNNQNAEANQDLLFAYTQPGVTPATITSANKPNAVGFSFGHMLSRIKFIFKNDFVSGSNISLKITDITITDLQKEGSLAITNGVAGAWTVSDNAVAENVFAKVFGTAGTDETILAPQTEAATEHFYLIPANDKYNVTFKVALYQAGVLLANYNRTSTVTLDMQKGNSYNIKANLNAQNTSENGELFPIEFTVTGVDEWGSYSDVNTTVTNSSTNN